MTLRTAVFVFVAGAHALPAIAACAQEVPLESALRFEAPDASVVARAWGGGPPGTLHMDSTIVHGGERAGRIERGSDSPGDFSTFTKWLPIEFRGDSVELRGFLRLEEVTEFAGLWLRQDGPAGPVAFDNMQRVGLRGTRDWASYSVRLPLHEDATKLFFGVLLGGEGKVWLDDLELLVDGKTIADAPRVVRSPTILERDSTFDAGSRITLDSVTSRQIENLALIARIWGFLKYHHPRVAAGEFHWDYEFFRVLPHVLATDVRTRDRVLIDWIDRLGEPETCSPCAVVGEDVHLAPDLGWIQPGRGLSSDLSARLRRIHANRPVGGDRFFISQTPVGNPSFANELPYADDASLDTGYRLLTLFRFWNIVEYWFPYRDQIEEDWAAVLEEFIPRFVEAESRDAFRLETLALVARVGDTHANLWSELDVRPPRGACRWPATIRFVEGEPTVTGTDTTPAETAFRIGDVVRSIDGESVDSLIEKWLPYYAASNRATQLRDIAGALPQGSCSESRVEVERDGRVLVVNERRIRSAIPPFDEDRPGEAFQLLSDEVAYLKLSEVRVADIHGYLQRAAPTRGLVIDIRNYPSEFVVFFLGRYLVGETTPFARFTMPDLETPGTFRWSSPARLYPFSPTYRGKVAILVNEVSQSQAEYTAMALRVAPDAVVVGSTTAGADGDISWIPLPGGMRAAISGIGVFYPDGTPTQRIGIVPDIEVRPTRQGIIDGRDEILEAALRHLLGPDTDEDMIRGMAD